MSTLSAQLPQRDLLRTVPALLTREQKYMNHARRHSMRARIGAAIARMT